MAIDVYGLPIAQTAGRVKVIVFTANGTYWQSSQLLYAWIRIVGGGGGGANSDPGGGGGGGGYAEKWLLQSQIGNPVTVTVGAGGATNAAGTASSFVANSGTITGNGGGAGSLGNGGNGGTGVGGDLNITGGQGEQGITGVTVLGGATHLGISPNLYGSGASTGGAGASGIVLVYEFLGS